MSESMLAAVYHGPDDLRVEQYPRPVIDSGDILVRVLRSGICATDIRIFHGAHRKFPPGTVRIPGHEVVGEIVELGEEAEGFTTGQRVFIAPNFGCGYCRQCITGNNNRCANYDAVGITLDGSFAEFMRIPQAAIHQGNLIPLAADVGPASAALIEPFACVLRGQEAVHIRPGENVVILGAGPIGVMHLLLAKLRGAGKVIVSEPSPERARIARDMDASLVINPTEEDFASVIRHETNGEGADVVIVAAPSYKAQQESLLLAAIGGRINFFGGLPKDVPFIQLNSNLVHYNELVVTGTTGCSSADCRKAAELVNSELVDLSRLVSATYPLQDTRQAFQMAESGKALKVILEP